MPAAFLREIRGKSLRILFILLRFWRQAINPPPIPHPHPGPVLASECYQACRELLCSSTTDATSFFILFCYYSLTFMSRSHSPALNCLSSLHRIKVGTLGGVMISGPGILFTSFLLFFFFLVFSLIETRKNSQTFQWSECLAFGTLCSFSMRSHLPAVTL